MISAHHHCFILCLYFGSLRKGVMLWISFHILVLIALSVGSHSMSLIEWRSISWRVDLLVGLCISICVEYFLEILIWLDCGRYRNGCCFYGEMVRLINES